MIAALILATVLAWTAVGDDGLLGTASAYECRYAADSTAAKTGTLIPLPAPKPAGSAEQATVTLPVGTWWLGLRALDEVPNAGPWAFVMVTAAAPDTTAPAPVVDLRVTGVQ